MRGPSPLYIEERHRALGRDATFSWSRALTHPPRCNRTRHRGRHLGSEVVGAAILDRKSWGPPSWIGSRGGRHLGSEVVGAAILDRKSWGPPSWIGSRGSRHLGPEVVGAAILDRKSWGPPSWTGSDVKNAKPAPLLLAWSNASLCRLRLSTVEKIVLRLPQWNGLFIFQYIKVFGVECVYPAFFGS